MIRVVLDTNIILSSLLQPLGPPAKTLYLVRRGFLKLLRDTRKTEPRRRQAHSCPFRHWRPAPGPLRFA